MTAETQLPERQCGRKAVIFCSECGHESPVDGEWAVDESDDGDGGRSEIECLECGHLVVSQPQFSVDTDGGNQLLMQPILQLLNAVVRHNVL